MCTLLFIYYLLYIHGPDDDVIFYLALLFYRCSTPGGYCNILCVKQICFLELHFVEFGTWHIIFVPANLPPLTALCIHVHKQQKNFHLTRVEYLLFIHNFI